MVATSGFGPAAVVWVSSGDYGREVLLLLGVLGVLAASVFYWALVLRKPRQRHRSRSDWRPPARSHAGAEHTKDKPHGWGRQRRRRREHRSQNPTLAETGGLPPVRIDRPPMD